LIPLHHAQVAQVEKVVNGVYADFNSRLLKGKVQVKLFADARTNTLIAVAPIEHIKAVSQLIMDLDRKNTPSSSNLHMFYPKNAKAETISKVINDLLTKVKGGKEKNQPLEFLREISVVSDVDTNTLLVAATPSDYELLMPIIDGLDIKRKQVLIEALILEVTMDRVAEFGINWNYSKSDGVIRSSPNTLGLNPLESYNGLRLGVLASETSLGAVAQALESDIDSKVISSPVIITLDNEEAEINDVKDKAVPESDVVTGTEANHDLTTTTKYKRKEFGIKLTVTPQILEDNRLLLSLYQEQSSSNNATTADATIKTKVLLNSSETVVLGGLIKDTSTETVNLVPCLGGVQGVGELFKHTNRKNDRTYTMVFIRPVIINDYQSWVDIGMRKYEEVKRGIEGKTGRGSIAIPTRLLDIAPHNIGSTLESD
jgi:general secretion pathway protein D